ncbi:hypothetical protein SAMN05216184_101700 [Georgenia satyanarayanai]|uniref:Uncharacterized protein n=1 Tax=Georgenia satyanarayanai TaxID=860221 RepID=A0A2Y9A4D4_9MICO|nr:hypothetical protein A8987_101700 [Georgenia satyanarayanai]SSA37067.1 hypothetical protein SAMN05216184_101700 [Georgenia satyanarayanai]
MLARRASGTPPSGQRPAWFSTRERPWLTCGSISPRYVRSAPTSPWPEHDEGPHRAMLGPPAAMTRVEELEFARPVVVFDGGTPYWHLVEALGTLPLTSDGISAFIRYEDEVATRYGYVVSRWVTQNQGQQYAGVLVYSVLPTDPGDAPGHPSDDPRFRETTEAHATTHVEAAQRLAGPASDPRGRALWAAAGPGGPFVPVSVTPFGRPRSRHPRGGGAPSTAHGPAPRGRGSARAPRGLAPPGRCGRLRLHPPDAREGGRASRSPACEAGGDSADRHTRAVRRRRGHR